MVQDPEKQDLAALETTRRDTDGPTVNPNTLPNLDDDSKRDTDPDSISIHTHSTEPGTIEGLPEGTDEKSPDILAHSKSRSASVRSRAVTIIPRAKRRGLLARFALVPEVSNPYEYKNKTKWGITLTVALAAAAAPMGSVRFHFLQNKPLSLTCLKAILLPALPELAIDLHTDTTITNLSVAMYMLSMSIFPLFCEFPPPYLLLCFPDAKSKRV